MVQLRKRKLLDYALLLATVLIVVIAHFFSEKITVGEGLGHDGRLYGAWVRDFDVEVLRKGLDPYYVQRILPSAVAHYSLRLLGLPRTNPHIVAAFVVLNVTMLSWAAWLWCLIADELNISRSGKYLGMVALFLNFAVLKCYAYDPVLTDPTAYFLGFLMLYCHLQNRKIGLWLATLAGSFVWPTILHSGIVLLLFPRRYGRRAPAASTKMPAILAFLPTLAFFSFMCGLLKHGFLLPNQAFQVVYSLAPISLVISSVYLLQGLFELLKGAPFLLRPSQTGLTLRALPMVVILLLVVNGLQRQLLSNSPPPHDTLSRLITTAESSIIRPGVFYLAHVLFYGPIALLALFFWRPTCRLIQNEGAGLTLCAILGLGLSLGSESRSFINFFPMLVAFVVKAVDALRWGPIQYALMVSLSLLFSKVWLTINTSPLTGEPPRNPDQLFFSSLGPWMSNTMYVVQGSAVLLGGLLVYIICVKRPNALRRIEEERTC